MTRPLCIVAFVAIIATASARAQAPIDPHVRAELVTAREAVWRAYFQGDSVALMHLLPAALTAMGRDRADVVRDAMGYARGGGKYGGMEFSDQTFWVNGNTAVLWSHYVAHLSDSMGTPTTMHGRAIEIFVKENGHWVNPHWHLDPDPSP